jgi:sterol 3beta-glucosyltransferase
MNITILTAGTRGDVQPYLALALELKARGHAVKLATGKNFADFVGGWGIEFAPLGIDYLDLTESPEARKALSSNPLAILKLIRDLQPIMKGLLEDCWQAAQDSDLLIYHPKTLAGPHIVEKLGIRGFAALTVPMLSPTGAFPLPGVISPNTRLGAGFNRWSYGLLNNSTAMFAKPIASFRTDLGLPSKTKNSHPRSAGNRRLPVLYCFSEHVVPRPHDWDKDSLITGYWNLPERPYTPDPALQRFLEQGEMPVYIGFGSMPGTNPTRLTQHVLEAIQQAGVRAVLATGWGALETSALPESVFALREAPHEWLFPRVAAVVHHGGMGTTAAGLQAGKPTIICPFATDQPFWGHRVHELGVGPKPIAQNKLSSQNLAAALREAVQNTDMRRRAEALSAKLSLENGAARAADIITRA